MANRTVAKVLLATECDRFRYLSAPFDRVRYTVDATSTLCIHVTYQGLPEDLLACGAATVEMLDFSQRKARNDQLLDAFNRRRLRMGRVEIQIRLEDVYRAIALPGVTMDDMHPAIRRVLQFPAVIVAESQQDYLGRSVQYGTREALIAAGVSREISQPHTGAVIMVPVEAHPLADVISQMNGVYAAFGSRKAKPVRPALRLAWNAEEVPHG